jgi:hypothetical protein
MNTTTAITRAGNGGGTSIEREGFEGRSIERRHETASTAVAAQAQAEIQARYVVARANPRDWDDVRTRLLRECSRSSFAARAIYSLPRGNRFDDALGRWVPNLVEGLSVRFAEAMIRLAGNIRQATATIYDDEHQRIVRVSVIDLETNADYSRDVVIEKTVERSKAGDRNPIMVRKNSFGKDVFLLEATEDELLEKEGRTVSKAFRTLALRFLPADVIEDANDKIRETRAQETAQDPEKVRKTIADSFASINVHPSDLKSYLGHDLGTCSPAELDQLRGLYAAIKGGDVRWQDALAERLEADGKEAPKTVEAKIAERAARQKKAPAAAAPQTTPQATSPAATSVAPTTPAIQPTTAPAAPVERSPGTCSVCKKTISFTDPAIATQGGGFRHTSCNPITGESDAEPPADVKTEDFK